MYMMDGRKNFAMREYWLVSRLTLLMIICSNDEAHDHIHNIIHIC